MNDKNCNHIYIYIGEDFNEENEQVELHKCNKCGDVRVQNINY